MEWDPQEQVDSAGYRRVEVIFSRSLCIHNTRIKETVLEVVTFVAIVDTTIKDSEVALLSILKHLAYLRTHSFIDVVGEEVFEDGIRR